MNTSSHRSRWAAIGAAVAVTLGIGAGAGIGISSATSPTGAVAYVPITPCRLIDTRPAPDTVGARSTPLGAGETLTISAHGANGGCTGGSVIPANATGLQLNVTAVGATASTYLTIWPSGAAQPSASSLNPQPGQGPVPNAVTTGLSGDGKFAVFNLAGSVNVLVDVVGYYTDHQHDDRYYTKAEVDAAVATRPSTSTGKIAYAWVCNAAANASVGVVTNLHTACDYDFSATGTPTVTRTATGTYTVVFPGLGLTRGHVQVTGYGSTSSTCVVSSWGGTSATIVCYDAAGSLANNRFMVLLLE